MPDDVTACGPRALVPNTNWYPSNLLPELQRTLAALADVELRYEAARERLEQSSFGVRRVCLSELNKHYRQKREPYTERLEQLQQQIRFYILSGL
jgi:hypothetical protein